MQTFRSRWIALNERCKRLEANLHEAQTEKSQLAAKLKLSREHMKRVEKEKEELSAVVEELHNDLKTNTFHKWIETLDQKLSMLKEPIPNDPPSLIPHIITNEPPRIIDDIVLSSSDDEEPYADTFTESPVIGQVTDENFEIDVLDVISSTSNTATTDSMGHDYVSPSRNKGDREVEENVRQISNNKADSCNEISSAINESISEMYPTLVSTNNKSLIMSECTTRLQKEIFLEEETSESNTICQIPTTDLFEKSLDGSHPCDVPFENAETSHSNQTIASTGIEVSTANTAISVENPPQCNTTFEPQTSTLNETENLNSDRISSETLISSRRSSSIILALEDEPCDVIDEEILGDDHLFESSTPLSKNPSQNIQFCDGMASSLTKNLDRNCDFSVIEQTSTLSPRCTSSTNGELSPSCSDNEESATASPGNTQEQILLSNVQDTEYNSTGCDNTENYRASAINGNTSDSRRHTPISNNDTPANDERSIDSAVYSASSSVTLTEHLSQPVKTITEETRVENCSKTTRPQKDVGVESPTSAKSFRDHVQTSSDETSDVNGNINHDVCLTDTITKVGLRNHQFTSESLLEQGVNHEEILPAEGDQLSNISGTEYFNETENNDVMIVDGGSSTNVNKSTHQEVSPEELMCQIFGSPTTSPDRNSNVVCVTKEPNCTIDFNLSDEEDKPVSNIKKPGSSVVQPELTVNLPRIFTPGVRIRESVDRIISDLDRDIQAIDNDDNESGLSKLKRAYPSPEREPSSKRSPLNESHSDAKKILKCSICKDDEVYECYSILDTHIIAKHPDPFPIYSRCHYGKGKCERHFRTTRKLNVHIRRRHAAENFSLPAEKLLPEQKPWPCSICDKSYTCNNDLRAHLHRTHGKTFVHKIYQKRKKSIKKSPTRGYSVGECIICLNDKGSSEKYKTYQELDDHIFRNHPNPYPYYLRCPFCKSETARHFKGLSWLNNHIANNHAVEVFQKTE